MEAHEARRLAASVDRRAGAALRRSAHGTRLRVAADTAAGSLAPAFKLAVAVLVATPRTRRGGAEALASGIVAATAARLLRDRLERPRPGPRTEGGFPSRHAAAAVAISRAASRTSRPVGAALALVAGAGLLGRVLVGEHEPADIGAGAALGWAADRAVERLAR